MALDLSALQGLASLMGGSSYLDPQSSNAGTAPMLASANGTPGQSFSQPAANSQINVQQLMKLLQQQQAQQQQQQMQQQAQQRMMTQPFAQPMPMQQGRPIQPMNWGGVPQG